MDQEQIQMWAKLADNVGHCGCCGAIAIDHIFVDGHDEECIWYDEPKVL